MKCKYYSKISLEKDNLQNTCNISITNIYQKPFSLVNLDKNKLPLAWGLQ